MWRHELRLPVQLVANATLKGDGDIDAAPVSEGMQAERAQGFSSIRAEAVTGSTPTLDDSFAGFE